MSDEKANRLRELRTAAALTREELSALTARLADDDPVLYKKVGVSTVEKLEAASTKPRPASARSLAAALNSSVADVFPQGLQVGGNNPLGKTRIPADRPKGGRPKKSP